MPEMVGSPPPTITTVPGSAPATTLVLSWPVFSRLSNAAAAVRTLRLDAGVDGVVSPCCHSAVPLAGSTTLPVSVPSAPLPAGPPRARLTPGGVGAGPPALAALTRGWTFAGGAGGTVTMAAGPPNSLTA